MKSQTNTSVRPPKHFINLVTEMLDKQYKLSMTQFNTKGIKWLKKLNDDQVFRVINMFDRLYVIRHDSALFIMFDSVPQDRWMTGEEILTQEELSLS